MSRLEKIYLRLPILMQNIICSVEGWRIQRTRFGAGFHQALHNAQGRSYWSHEQVVDYRNQRLKQFVEHAATTVPYYRRLFAEYGFQPSAFETLNDLQKLPILSKADIQQNHQDFESELIAPADRITLHTSGTTGAGLRFSTTQQAIEETWAIWWRYRQWHGIRLDTPCGYFGGRSVVPLNQTKPPFWRHNLPGHQLLFSAYHMSHENLPYYVEALRKAQPMWLHGYPSLMALLASYLLEKGETLGYDVRFVTVGAENLTSHQESIMTQAFGVRPLQHYGMSEGVANVSLCPQGNLHVDEDYAAVEFIPNDNGGSSVIGTNFSNLSTPLLRYNVQDFAWVDADATCDCGRPGRVIRQIDGRAEDYIILKNGSRVGRMDHVFKDLVHIREAQLYQERPGHIEVRIVKGEQYTDEDEQRLKGEMHQRVGTDTELTIRYLDQLTRSHTGKLRFVVSDIDDAAIK